MSEKAISSTTQEFLDVYDIVNDMVLLKDGTASIIMQVGTMNFSLLAEQEQDAIIFTYGSLLNSLNYPIQISIQSQTKDVTKYLRLLDEQVQKASSDRKAALIKQYRNFVAALIKERNVLEKHFYITVPAGPAEMGLITPSSVLPGKTAFDITTIEKIIILEKAINILEPRRDHLTAQFNRLGLYVRQLNTQEIIQNFYINYNPEAAEGQEISNNENYTTPLVRASFGGKNMQTNDQMPKTTTSGATATDSVNPNLQSPTPEEILSNKPLVNQAPAQQVDPPPINIPETKPVESVEPATQDAIAQEPMTPTLEPTTLEPTSTEPVTQATDDATSNVNLDLNLDSNLIKNSQPEQIPVFDPNQNSNDLMSNVQPAPVVEKIAEPKMEATSSTPEVLASAPEATSSAPEVLASVETPVETPVEAPMLAPIPAETPVLAPENPAPTETPVEIEVRSATANPIETEATSEPSNDFAEEITPLQNKLEDQTAEKATQVNEPGTATQSQT